MFDRGGGTGSRDPRNDPRFDGLELASRNCGAFLFNLETCIGSGSSLKPKVKAFVFRSPAPALSALSRLPQPIAALANNHSMDYGSAGLATTIAALDSSGVLHAGAGRNSAEARAPALARTPGGGMAILSRGFDGDPESFDGAAGPVIAPIDLGELTEDIAACRAAAAAVVVILHWGVEYATAYTAAEAEFARKCVEAGADMVIGTGPHVLRGVELYRGSLICYSLGNLVFDDLGDDETSTALLARMRIEKDAGGKVRRSYAIAPLRTRRVEEGPRAPTRGQARRIVEALALRSPDPSLLEHARFERLDGLYWFELGP